MNLKLRRFWPLWALGVLAIGVVGVLVLREPSGSGRSMAPLEQASAVGALLTAEDVGAGYTPGNAEAESYAAQAPGCLAAVRALIQGADAEVRVQHTYAGPVTEPASVVSSQVSSYETSLGAQAALATFRDATAGCTSVRPAKGKGGLDVRVAAELISAPEYDEQIRVRATGSSVTAKKQGFPIGIWISVVRHENNLAIIRLIEVPNLDEADAEARGEATLDRLVAAAVARLTAAT